MERIDIINKIGKKYLTSNQENGEWDYVKSLKLAHKEIPKVSSNPGGGNYQKIDIRFVGKGLSILVETKKDIYSNIEEYKKQIQSYIEYEKVLTGNNIVAILASIDDNSIITYRGCVSNSTRMINKTKVLPFEDYYSIFSSSVNDKEKVMQNTYNLNIKLHKYGIPEKLRSQFVGTCILGIKYGMKYEDRKTHEIISNIKSTLNDLLDQDNNKTEKVTLLAKEILSNQHISNLDSENFIDVLKYISKNIIPYIDDKSTAGQDLLNLFFVQFNKYVGKADKNQAFTPDHITDFMSSIVGINKGSKILDPCCGSASFLVRAMTHALDNCATPDEQDRVKKNNIYGFEYEDVAFGLATTNMLIHSDGNSRIKQGSCFDKKFVQDLESANIDIVLMNPPYNAQPSRMPSEYVKTWNKKQKEDPSKGLYFVNWVSKYVKTGGKIAVLLPMQCAINTTGEIGKYKQKIMENNTLDAVFSMPNDIFYPGANVIVCCMIFKVGIPHNDKMNPSTYFGYYKDDGFIKKKNLGRVEKIDPETGNSHWEKTKRKWMDSYRDRTEEAGFSVVQKVSYEDEWLAEAYMRTDYTKITESDFERTVRQYVAYMVKKGDIND